MHSSSKFIKFIQQIAEIFCPNHCLCCDEIINKDASFCSQCWPNLEFITEPKCIICSYPFEVEIKHMQPLCALCLTKKPTYDRSITIFRYNNVMKKIIGDLKYRDWTFLAKKFAKILHQKAKDEIDNSDLICAVPLHLKRLRKRKFNQSILIGRNLSKTKFIPDLLWRVADTKPQVELKRQEREKNLKRAFLVNKKYRKSLNGKKVLLIDDVMTTGATLHNCAKALKKSGAKEVVVLTIAKTVFNHH